MQTAAQLENLVKKYRRLCQDIEWAKLRLLGGTTFPVDPRRWKAWWARQARQKHAGKNSKTAAKLSDNPHYKHLRRLARQLNGVSFDLMHGNSYEAEENLLRAVIMSFPSLREIYDPHLSALSVTLILGEGENFSPQAYHAALFLDTLESRGMQRHKSDPIFFMDKAFEVWDDAHKEAFAQWLAMPFFPGGEFRRLSTERPSL